ncbi:hypothetical protein GWR20_17215 [Mycolicibacter kumamotonensis]|jgi:hypothetical protein|uniref:ArsR family transcriptional regulator n=2 Tax=Mycolicibacter kumamotonensis TaxID=354243 RepID=A0A7K3LEX1_9MYCO|nr:hypothetical protein [Mycolicibacter kumamotonensis]
MRSVAPALLPIFRSEHQAGLLGRLFLADDEIPMTDLARDLNIPLTTLHREVERLEEASLLASRRVGRTRLVRANREHPAAPSLADLLMVTFGPRQVIAEEFAGLGADAVILFGSWARRFSGETGPFPGAVDVLVVGNDSIHHEVHDAAAAAQRRLGVEVNPMIRSRADWENALQDPLVADIRAGAFVHVLPNRVHEHAATPHGARPTRRQWCVYRLRPAWSPRYEPDVYVPSDLQMLNGPTSGRFDPPVNLYWQPGELDFSDRADLELFYSSALTSANTPEQYAQWISEEALIAVWDRLSLPSRVRNAWETLHPGLRNEDAEMNDRIRIQDTILTAIAEHGFALAGGSALIDYDVVSRETDDIDAFNDHWDVETFASAHEAILEACRENGWGASTVLNEDFRRQVLVHAGTGEPVTVDIVYYERSREPEHRPGGGLRLVFDDVVGGKAVAVADSARGRDFDDLAHIVETPGWSIERVEDAMRAIKYGDKLDEFRANLERFRRGEFDEDIRKSGFDPAFCHRILG